MIGFSGANGAAQQKGKTIMTKAIFLFILFAACQIPTVFVTIVGLSTPGVGIFVIFGSALALIMGLWMFSVFALNEY